MSQLTEWIDAERNKRGWSQNELARKSGLTTAAMSHINTGAVPGLKACKGIAKAFDVSEQFVLELAGQVRPENIDRNELGNYERKMLEAMDGAGDDFKATVLKCIRDWRHFYDKLNSK